MITLTFEPTCPEQAALLGAFLPQYMKAGSLVMSGPAADVAQAVETAAVAVEAAAPAKKPRAAKPAANAAAPSAPLSPATESESAAPTSANSASDAGEGNAAAVASEPAAPAASTASSGAPAKEWTLEEVRARLAELSKAGKQTQVVSLIGALGAKKLTDVPADKYSELMAQAEAL